MNQTFSSPHQEMGPISYEGGVSFRVWAPHAEQVFVTGNFNNWSPSAHPLTRENGGCWATVVPGAKAGDQYKYLIIKGEQQLFRIDPCSKQVICSNCNSVIYHTPFDWGTETVPPPPWQEMVIYEMHVGTFHCTESGKPGNFTSAMAKLDYLQDLGVNTIEVMPAMEFRGSFSWGYNPAVPYAIESDYGGPKAFKDFIHAAHARGLAVILDVVYNHFGPGDLDLWRFDGWYEHNKGGIYFYNDWRSKTPWGDTRPDYGRKEIRQYIFNNAMMWLEDFHLDGLRWDATAFIRNVYGNNNDPDHDIAEGWSLMQWINDEIKKRYPDKISLAEDIRNNHFITKSVSEGGAGFDAQWDELFVRQVRAALTSPEDKAVNMKNVKSAIEHSYDGQSFARVIYTESHDEVANGKVRLPQEVSPQDTGGWIAKKLSTIGAALVFTSPGIPMIFQGQEFLEDEWFHDKDPLDWPKKEIFAGIWQLYKDLIHLRRNRKGNTRGLCGSRVQVYHVNQNENILAFQRYETNMPQNSVVIVLNLKHRESGDYLIGFPRQGLWKVRFNSDANLYDSEFGNCICPDIVTEPVERDGQPSTGKVNLGPYSVLILSQDVPST